jgi:hypothetical protein
MVDIHLSAVSRIYVYFNLHTRRTMDMGAIEVTRILHLCVLFKLHSFKLSIQCFSNPPTQTLYYAQKKVDILGLHSMFYFIRDVHNATTRICGDRVQGETVIHSL